jgi:hypothetical protein
MGYSSERRAAALTVLRARALAAATGSRTVSVDAEAAVSGYLDEDLPEDLIYLYPDGLPADDPVRGLIPAGPAPLDSTGTPLAVGQHISLDDGNLPIEGRIVYLDDLYVTSLITNEYERPEYVPTDLSEAARYGTVRSEV